MNKKISILFLAASCMLAGFGQKETHVAPVFVSPISCQSEQEQAVLSAFRQDKTQQNKTGQNGAEQTAAAAQAAEPAAPAAEGLQEQKTVSGNTISDLEIELEKVLAQVNQARKDVGQEELVWNDDLASAAEIRAEEIHTSFSHTRPDGSEWWSVNTDIIYGENLAKGYQSADSVMAAWLASAEHKDNILYAGFRSIGIAVYEADGKWYWAQEFGY